MAAFTSPLHDPVSIRILAVCARHDDFARFIDRVPIQNVNEQNSWKQPH
jgi:hypothetical protein